MIYLISKENTKNNKKESIYINEEKRRIKNENIIISKLLWLKVNLHNFEVNENLINQIINDICKYYNIDNNKIK